MSGELVLQRGVGKPSTCRSCKATIVFAETNSGKLAPFELDPKGNYKLENGKAIFIGTPTKQLELGETEPTRYSSHFANCEHAPKWRSKK